MLIQRSPDAEAGAGAGAEVVAVPCGDVRGLGALPARPAGSTSPSQEEPDADLSKRHECGPPP